LVHVSVDDNPEWLLRTTVDAGVSNVSPMTIRYGIIGTGMMGLEHIFNLNHLDGTEITAIADPVEESRAQGRTAAGDQVAVFADHRDLLASDLCDAVVVATPNMTHRDILLDVLDTDMHVLVEKPLCTTVEDCLTVMEAARDRSGVVWVGLEYRYMAPVARLIDEVRAGTPGALHMVAIREHRFPFLPKVGDWNRFTANTGGTLVEKCCHFFDLMHHIVEAPPVRVMASGGQDVNHLDEVYDGRSSDILDNAYVIVEFENGVRAMLDLCMFAEATFNQTEISVVGDKGKVEALVPADEVRIGLRNRHFIGTVDRHQVSPSDIPYLGQHHGSSYVEHTHLMEAIQRSKLEEAAHFAEAVQEGGKADVSLRNGMLSVAMGVAAHRSIDEGRIVDMAEVLPS